MNFVCEWEDREANFAKLSQLLQEQLGDIAHSTSLISATTGTVVPLPAVQPFHALSYPFSMSEMLQISKRYAVRAKLNVALTAEGTHYTHRPKPNSVRLKSKL